MNIASKFRECRPGRTPLPGILKWLGFLALACLPHTASALDNAARITEKTGSAQEDRPVVLFWHFAKDEICDYPRPYVDGAAVTPWQSDIDKRYAPSGACPAGSVQRAYVSFRTGLAANATAVVDFRNSADRCSAGDNDACNAAGFDQAGMLSFNGGTWDFQMSLTPSPAGGASTQNASARTMVAAGHWSYLLRGPVLTRVRVEDTGADRIYDFGWQEKWYIRGGTTVSNSATSALVYNVPAAWSSLPRPFLVGISALYDGGYEVAKVCFLDSTHLYFGDSNGSDPSCANVNGRGQDGTSARTLIAGVMGLSFAANPTTQVVTAYNGAAQTVTLDSTASLTTPTELRILGEVIRVCKAEGNVLTIGVGGSGCSYHPGGRSHWGTNDAIGKYGVPSVQPRTFVHALGSVTDWWTDPLTSSFKSLHPRFDLDFFAGYSGVGGRFTIDNTWTDRRQDQEYDATLSTSGGTIYTSTGSRHVWATRRTFPITSTTDAANPLAWDGTTPGAVRVDFNFRYKKHIGLIPNDPDVAITQSAINVELTGTTPTQDSGAPSPGWDVGGKCNWETKSYLDASSSPYHNYAGPMWRSWDGPGGRMDLAPIPRNFVATAYSWSSSLPNAERLNEAALGTGSCAAYVPIHYREHDTVRYYCRKGNYPANTNDTSCPVGSGNYDRTAFGLPVSIDARPTYVGYNYFGEAGDQLPPPVGNMTYNRFVLNSISFAHSVSLAMMPFMMTGHEFYRDETMWMGHNALINHDISFGYDPDMTWCGTNENCKMNAAWHQRGCSSASGYCLGWIGGEAGYRGHAWGVRDLAYGAWAAKAGTPQNDYLNHRWKNQMAMEHGLWNITEDEELYIPCADAPANARSNHSPWCFGRTFKGRNAPNATFANMDWANTYINFVGGAVYDTQKVFSVVNYWHDGYLHTSLGIAQGMGLPYARRVRIEGQKRALHILNGSGGINPFRISLIESPGYPCLPEGTPQVGGCGANVRSYGGQQSFSSFSQLNDAFIPASATCNVFTSGVTTCNPAFHDTSTDLVGGYARIASAGASFLLDGVEDAAEIAYTPTRAWDWLQANLLGRNNEGTNPMWVYSPPAPTLIRNVRKVDNTLLFSAPDGKACTYAVDPASSLDQGDTTVTDLHGREQRIDITGLSSATIRVTCGAGRVYFQIP